MKQWLIDNRDLITNILGFLMFLYEPVTAYLTNEPFDWQTFLACIMGALVAYLTGKGREMSNAKREM